jgi:hypothetical protein
VAAKRSPILGYNHNVKYRGVVFHVQTEDSGQQNPHLFTHLFHEGVIVSTRKLVYDAGSNEESIKSLMQAQHKAVMKDLKKGTFDDKIDAYLSGVEGLEPRAGTVAGAAPLPRGERAPTEVTPPVEDAASPLEISGEDLSEPIELPIKGSRVQTGDQTRPISMPIEPAAIEDNAPTLLGSSAAELAAAFRAQEAARTQASQDPPPVVSRTGTAPRVSRSGVSPQRPGLEIIEDEPSRGRAVRDTTLELDDVGDGVPSRQTQDSIPPPTTPVRAGTPPSHGAAALPATKQPVRPSLSPPVVTRPVTGDRHRAEDSEAVEIYQPAPSSVEPPPGERSERPGQYSVSRKSADVPLREKTGRIAAINPGTLGHQAPPTPQKPGTGRIAQPGSGASRAPTGIPREPTPQNQARPGSGPQMPRAATPPPTPSAALRGGAPQPMRVHVTAPIHNRTPTPATPAPGSGVVMTRPAVIVGAPPRPPQGPSSSQKIRKAREDEGRGFGQGLISEKSLDEVILAYLSEDAEEK